MINYQYQVIRYVHDQFTREFGNVGIVLYAPEQNYLSCKVVNRYSRLSDFFGEMNGHFLMAALKRFEATINTLLEDKNSLFSTLEYEQDLHVITNAILPRDDSALQLTNVIHGLDMSADKALVDLYDRIIERYNIEEHTHSQTDQQAWSHVYKNYFEKQGVAGKLDKHMVNTKKDSIKFDKAWKNGIWNCLQPLAFDLKTEEAIKNKVYKWSGIVRELETAVEEIHLYFLTTSPREHKQLNTFIKDTLTHMDKKLVVDVIREQDAERFAIEMRKAMEESHVIGTDDELF